MDTKDNGYQGKFLLQIIHFYNAVLRLFLVFMATVAIEVVIPAKAGIQCFQASLDAGSGPA